MNAITLRMYNKPVRILARYESILLVYKIITNHQFSFQTIQQVTGRSTRQGVMFYFGNGYNSTSDVNVILDIANDYYNKMSHETRFAATAFNFKARLGLELLKVDEEFRLLSSFFR